LKSLAQTILIGRIEECDYIVYDPLNRVSRKHALLIKEDSNLFIQDLGSSNGTFLDGRQIKPNVRVPLKIHNKITLSRDYELDFQKIRFPDLLQGNRGNLKEKDDQTILKSNSSIELNSGGKTILFDRNNAKMEDLSKHEVNKFKSFGRALTCDIQLESPTVSKSHLNIRLLTSVIFEIEDLNSTNGTFVDEEKLLPNKRYQFSSSAQVRLGNNLNLELRKYFPEIFILEKKAIVPPPNKQTPPSNTTDSTREELKQFKELENVWKEYTGRQSQASSVATGFGIGGAVFGLAAVVFTGATGGLGAMVLMTGGGILGRYLGQKQSNKIKGDLTFEDAFLEVYACPRCKESFQKKPWITIRECFKCKTKYR
jgi:pSer/pThr/pTyr-binding forkhead associated (FHA) protein